MMIPNHVENWVMIIELNKMSITSLPLKPLGSIIGSMQINFCGRLDKMYMMNPSSGLKFGWKSIKSFIDPDTGEKITFLNETEFGEL